MHDCRLPNQTRHLKKKTSVRPSDICLPSGGRNKAGRQSSKQAGRQAGTSRARFVDRFTRTTRRTDGGEAERNFAAGRRRRIYTSQSPMTLGTCITVGLLPRSSSVRVRIIICPVRIDGHITCKHHMSIPPYLGHHSSVIRQRQKQCFGSAHITNSVGNGYLLKASCRATFRMSLSSSRIGRPASFKVGRVRAINLPL